MDLRCQKLKLVSLTCKYICQPLFLKLRNVVLGAGVKRDDGKKYIKAKKYKIRNDNK